VGEKAKTEPPSHRTARIAGQGKSYAALGSDGHAAPHRTSFALALGFALALALRQTAVVHHLSRSLLHVGRAGRVRADACSSHMMPGDTAHLTHARTCLAGEATPPAATCIVPAILSVQASRPTAATTDCRRPTRAGN